MNDNPEQHLVNEYVKYLTNENDNIILINKNCKSKQYADLEYIDNKVLWVIEAKSHKSKDAYNSIHKLFGELLKETGRERISDNKLLFKTIKYGLLIPGDVYDYTNKSGIMFYKKHFLEIKKDKYIQFGKLIPINDIFIFDIYKNELVKKTWSEFVLD